jgi:hypothetical protein
MTEMTKGFDPLPKPVIVRRIVGVAVSIVTSVTLGPAMLAVAPASMTDVIQVASRRR